MAINAINGANTSFVTIPKTENSNSITAKFSDFLNNAIDEVNSIQVESEKIANDFAIGKTDNIHEVMIAGEKANIALQFTMQIRNKVMEGYTEIMRMAL